MISRFLHFISPFSAFQSLQNILYERRCPACQTIHSEHGLCSSCRSSIKTRPENICIICGNELNSPDAELLPCITCQTLPRNFSRLYFYGFHEGLLRNMLLGWKFNGQYGYNAVFKQFVADLCSEIPAEHMPDLIVPVPLHSSRIRGRGFNQSMHLAKFAAAATGIKFSAKALHRARRTTPQTRLSGAQRRTNLHSAFVAGSTLIKGKNILLIDDVYTTGSTADECARTLLESGARQVEVMTISRALL
ncbi:MAG TPA: ComF family protein [Desulfovibrio sp.]|nr:ComF family protein [Desulfovibrio sp.]